MEKSLHHELRDFEDIEFEEKKGEKEEDLKMLLDQALFQVSVLQDLLDVANGEIKFLRGELSSTQLSLLSSRSEVSTLLEELTTYRSGKEWKEEFPDLLLSSLDKLYQDKQQQLYLISGIHNTLHHDVNTGEECVPESANSSDNLIKCDSPPLPTKYPQLISQSSDTKVEPEDQKVKKPPPSLTLDLTKSYDFSPSTNFGNKRSLTTPCGIAPFRWTPTTPTPCSALRPSLSLHNLESKTFTEVLIPSIKPPDTHQVSPHNSASPKSPLILKQGIEERKVRKNPTSNDPNKCNSNTVKSINHIQAKTCKKKKIIQTKPQTRKSLKSPVLRPYTSLSSLAEISENLTFLECKKEISV